MLESDRNEIIRQRIVFSLLSYVVLKHLAIVISDFLLLKKQVNLGIAADVEYGISMKRIK